MNLSKIESTSIVTDNIPFDLTEQIRQSILLLEPKWEKKKVEMIIDLDEVTYCGNQQLLNQVWINLIDNAVKFTPEKTKVKIKLRKSIDEVSPSSLCSGHIQVLSKPADPLIPGAKRKSRNDVFCRFCTS